jgi:uncharacterized phage infection (PIP) family protein YhgE
MFNKSKKELIKKVKELKEENARLKDTIIESVELVADYRKTVEELNKFVNQIYQSQVQQIRKEYQQTVVDEFNEFEQEDVEEYVEKLTKKKSQIH